MELIEQEGPLTFPLFKVDSLRELTDPETTLSAIKHCVDYFGEKDIYNQSYPYSANVHFFIPKVSHDPAKEGHVPEGMIRLYDYGDQNFVRYIEMPGLFDDIALKLTNWDFKATFNVWKQLLWHKPVVIAGKYSDGPVYGYNRTLTLDTVFDFPWLVGARQKNSSQFSSLEAKLATPAIK